jgi:hypothetical protein
MFLAFIILLSINLFRGHEFNCGCFSLKETGYINEYELADEPFEHFYPSGQTVDQQIETADHDRRTKNIVNNAHAKR